MERSRGVTRWSKDNSRSRSEPPNRMDRAKSERQRAPCRSDAVLSRSNSSSVTRKLTRRVRILRMGGPLRNCWEFGDARQPLTGKCVASPLRSHSKGLLKICPEVRQPSNIRLHSSHKRITSSTVLQAIQSRFSYTLWGLTIRTLPLVNILAFGRPPTGPDPAWKADYPNGRQTGHWDLREAPPFRAARKGDSPVDGRLPFVFG